MSGPHSLSAILLAAALFPLVGPARAAPQAAEPPARVCARLKTDDTLRPVPEALAPAVNATFHTKMPAAMVARGTVFRCVDGKVKVCTTGANLPCGKADQSQTPGPGIVAWCRERPEVTFVPAAAAGHDTIWEWRCRNGVPKVGKQVLHVDPRGFVVETWRELR
ncbi:MAG: hypothetical protein J0H67_20500 [Rhodospirillales bacterium]|nr:hypothetical protein [Rhodospirillales bacterium]